MNEQNTSKTTRISEGINYLSNSLRNTVNSFVQFLLSGNRSKFLVDLRSAAERIDSLKDKMSRLTDEELKLKTEYFKQLLREGKTLDDILEEGFAVVREAAKRVLNEEPYLVQIMGGIVIHKGMLAEMKTGEGKTLVAILPAYLNALSGKGVHIVTVNDYLARRETEWMGRVFRFLGMSVGCVTSGTAHSDKKTAYDADITYCTNNELGFDFLRDNMVDDKSEKCQRGLHFCIVDEADSVLIDEARTPLIISGPTNDHSEGYLLSDSIVKKLQPEHYKISLKDHRASFTDEGIDAIESILKESGFLGEDSQLYSPQNSVLLHQLGQALRANHLYRLEVDYIIENEQDAFGSKPAIKIIDEHTGRTLHGRRYSDGLHQALEAKERVPIRPESETLASITFQRLFKMYSKLSGMTGTALTEAEEFESTYNLKVAVIPTNRPVRRIDHDDEIYVTKFEKIKAIVGLVDQCHRKGQPVMVGSSNVESSEEIYDILERSGYKVNLLNAKNHEREAEIIANAGRFGSITVVTNIAGRGTDIKLGGDIRTLLKRRVYGIEDPDVIRREEENISLEVAQNKKDVLEAGGLFVIGVEHNNNRRIDNQLRGRSGRQGDPGESQFFMSTEDDLIMKFNPNLGNILRAFGAQENEVMKDRLLTGAIENAQKRLEAMHFESRQGMMRYSNLKESYKALFDKFRDDILDTDRAESMKKSFQEVLSSPKMLERTLQILEYSNDDAGIRALHNAFDEKIDLPHDILNKIMLYNVDANSRRYEVVMTHARDVVAFQAYTQRDPVMSYYNIATNKFAECITNVHIDNVVDLIRFQKREFNYEDEMEAFRSLKDYLMNNQLIMTEENEQKLAEIENTLDEFKKVFDENNSDTSTEVGKNDNDSSDDENGV